MKARSLSDDQKRVLIAAARSGAGWFEPFMVAEWAGLMGKNAARICRRLSDLGYFERNDRGTVLYRILPEVRVKVLESLASK